MKQLTRKRETPAQRVGEVGLPVLLEFGHRARLGDLAEGLLGVLGAQLAEPLERDQFPVHTRDRRRVDLDMKVRPLPLDEGAQR